MSPYLYNVLAVIIAGLIGAFFIWVVKNLLNLPERIILKRIDIFELLDKVELKSTILGLLARFPAIRVNWNNVAENLITAFIISAVATTLWAIGILPTPSFLRHPASASAPKPQEPPRLEIHPSPESLKVGCGLAIDEKGQASINWQFQTYITITNPTDSPTGDVLIRTRFFTGRNDNWLSEIREWYPGSMGNCVAFSPRYLQCKQPYIPATSGLVSHVKLYQVKSGDYAGVKKYRVVHEPARTIGYGGCTAWKCIPEPKRRFKAHDKFKHLLYPELADDPESYLCDGTAKAVLRVKLIWDNEDGQRQQPLTQYLRVKCDTDPRGPEEGKARPKIFNWVDVPENELPKGVSPPPE